MTSVPVLNGPVPVVLCIGDSLTEFASQPNGWASHLQNHYVSRRDVMLRGMSGYNSRWLRKCLKQILPKQEANQNIAVITLLIGTNDSVNPDAKSGPGWPQQHVPVEEYEDNVRAIVNHLVEFSNTDGTKPVVVVASPPPQDGEDWHNVMMTMLGGNDSGSKSKDGSKDAEQKTDISAPKQRSCEAVRPYAEVVQRVVNNVKDRIDQFIPVGNEGSSSQSNQIVFVDLYNDMLNDAKGWRRFLCEDGVHFSQDGNKFMFGRLASELKGIEGSPDELPRHAPHFFDVISAFGK